MGSWIATARGLAMTLCVTRYVIARSEATWQSGPLSCRGGVAVTEEVAARCGNALMSESARQRKGSGAMPRGYLCASFHSSIWRRRAANPASSPWSVGR